MEDSPLPDACWFVLWLVWNWPAQQHQSSLTVINKLKRHFSVQGIPQKLYSDNGNQYTSQAFHDFTWTWDFQHVTSSPEYPQSNGLSERAVRSAKKLLWAHLGLTCTKAVPSYSNHSAHLQTIAKTSCKNPDQHQSTINKEAAYPKTLLRQDQPATTPPGTRPGGETPNTKGTW